MFGSSIDVRKPDAKTTGTLAVYSTKFEDELFTDLLREGAFIEDVVFWVSEAPDCPSSVPREVEAEHFHSEDRAERRELGGRAWQLNTKLWRLRDTNVNKVTYSYAVPVAETGTCGRLNAGYSERMAPRGPEDRSKYVRFDPGKRRGLGVVEVFHRQAPRAVVLKDLRGPGREDRAGRRSPRGRFLVGA